jgi:GTP-binding protein
MNHFVDYVRIHVIAGDGGDGVVRFHREKYVEFGGPSGGDGGRGGSVILQADEEMTTLLDFKMRTLFAAEKGKDGGSNKMSGRGGKDLLLKVPLGTSVLDLDSGEELGDLTKPGQQLVIAKGGDGGLGNQHFATPTNKAPRKAIPGTEGEERNVVLELKVIADAGLVGLPNAGKSTLLAHLTSAHPKIAPYPFTTLSPNLGVFLAGDFQSRITLADIPGLIEGAHAGAGLGDRFLRHIERTKVLVHLVGPEAGETAEGEMTAANADPEALLYAYDLVESELRQYSRKLIEKHRIVCLTKIDLLTGEQVEEAVAAFRQRGVDVIPISALKEEHLDELRRRIEEVVLQQRAEESTEPTEGESTE